MIELLFDLYGTVKGYGGEIPLSLQIIYRKEYRRITRLCLAAAGGAELARPPGVKRGRVKRPKYRNLLERLIRCEDELLRFMTSKNVPFFNNDPKRPVRIIKVHMKISGCFRSFQMGQGFCKMRSYIVSCQKTE
jgi:transposase